ncbi:MAG: SDR family oxidoreductase [Myxococcota bacterium]
MESKTSVTNDLDGKFAVILGGTSGMGYAAAERFLAAGAKVLATGRSRETIEKARQALNGPFEAVQADIADYEATREAIEKGVSRFGGIDVFYQVAGIGQFAPFELANSEHYERMIKVDLTAPIVALLNARKHLNDGASVIFTTTSASTRAMPTMSAYGAAKAGLAQFARVLALELAARKIRVNVISPGPIDTPMIKKVGLPEPQAEATRQFFTAVTPLGRFGNASEVAEAAHFLASAKSSFVTGVTLEVDGGFSESWHLPPAA